MALLQAFAGRNCGWSLLLLLGSVNAACSGYKPPPKVNLDALMEPRAVEGTPLQEVWTRRVGRGLGGAIAQTDSVVYFGAADRHVIAIDLRNGIERWSSRVQGPIAEGVAIDERHVFAHTERPDGRVYGVDILRGNRSWSRQVGMAAAPPVTVGGLLLTSTRAGFLYALETATGEVKWRRRLGIVRAPVFIASNGNLIASTVDSLFRIASSDGKVLERRKSPGAVLTGWATHSRFRIAGTTDSTVIGMLPDSISAAWSVRLDAPVIGTPIVRGDTAYALTRIGSVYRILIDSVPSAERMIALRTPFLAAPVMIQNWIVIGTADGLLMAITPEGAVAWQVQISGPIELTPLLLSDGFLAIGGRGDLHRYRL
jgi:eukaryotic-like serine/threonine-protein kinase